MKKLVYAVTNPANKTVFLTLDDKEALSKVLNSDYDIHVQLVDMDAVARQAWNSLNALGRLALSQTDCVIWTELLKDNNVK